MKNSNFKSSFLFFLFLLITCFSFNASALTFPHTDNFNSSSADGWSRDDGSYGYLQIDRDKYANKNYDFSNTYANAEVTVTFLVFLGEDWESGDDFSVEFNNAQAAEYHGVNDDWTYYIKTLTTHLDENGDIKIQFSTDTSKNSEKAYIDYVKIEYTAIEPEITPATYTIYNQAPTDAIVGSIIYTGEPDIFSILSGNTNNTFNVTNTGDITVASGSALENNTTSTFTLEINASNSNGYDVENFIINLTDDINLSTEDVNTRDFTNVSINGSDSLTINGSILQIGNQLLCKNSSNGGTCVDPTSTGNTQNNHHTQYYAKIDTSVGAPSNNSMAKLLMEDGDEVIFARLYWSARIENITSTEKTNAKSIQIKGPNASSYTSLTSPNSKYNWHDSGSQFDYAASQDVTEYVKEQGTGEYYVGGIQAQTGETGTYASWQLIVVVENPSRSLKNLTIYDGFYSVLEDSSSYPESVSVDASGFITPTGDDPFNANLFIYMGESDYGYDDSIELLKKDGNENNSADWHSLKDGANDTTDVVNASIYSPDYTGGYRSNVAGMANPNFKNVLGVDIDELPINVKTNTSQQFLSNSQTETKIKITSDGDRFSLNMFAFETEVFVPEFCYDYAYSQYKQFFTEDNDGTNPPQLVGNILNGADDEIEVSIFIKSLVESSISIDNMRVDISDINATQANYVSGTTKVAYVGDLAANPVAVTTGTNASGNEYIHNINIGSLANNEYFYVFYQLDPNITTINMPLTVHASYDLTLNSTSVEYTLKLSEDIPMCSLDNFNYLPPKGIFNIVHNNFYTNTSIGSNTPNGMQYYNLPTQVTQREGNFKVISMDPDNLDELEGKDTVAVAVEMIDVAAFHYTDASCKNVESAISDRVWVIFENNETSTPFNQATLSNAVINGLTDIPSSTEFYKEARSNAAFRTSYNASDNNGSLIGLDLNSSTGKYDIINLPSYTTAYCGQDMNDDNVTNDLITGYCPTTGLSKAQVKQCMECIYGLNTRLICSRDNFSIRPESFLIKINDQNQSNPTTKLRLADDVSGITSTPSTTELQLASGYKYNLEINATNHLSNAASPGYKKYFTEDSIDFIEYTWSPTGITTGCNDTNNSRISINLNDGLADFNSSLSQVGRYLLNMKDTTWTTVDNNPLYMTHHDGVDSGTYFLSSFTPDCIVGTSDTQPTSSSARNGCDIDSNHDSSYISSVPNVHLKYRDYNVTFHPYKFQVLTNATIGTNNDPIILTNGINPTSYFLYMGNISDDINMSLQLNTNIIAQGEDNSTLSNFVEQCFSKPIDINITKSAITNTNLQYNYAFQDLNSSGGIISTNDINGTIDKGSINNANLALYPNLTTDSGSTSFFQKDQAGALSTRTSLNFSRENNTTENPESVTFGIFRASDPRTMFNADLVSTKTADGFADINKSTIERLDITHYYGKAHTGRQRFEVPTDANYTTNIHYEIFCFGITHGQQCNLALLQNPLNLKRTDDSRWYVNTNHDMRKDGNVSTVVQSNNRNLVMSGNQRNINSTTSFDLAYDASKGYPYKTTMDINTSNWLIYNRYDENAIVNQFPVEFEAAGTSWSGESDINTTTQDPGTVKTNRRSMW